MKLNNIILLLTRVIFFPNGHIHNVVSTLPNVVKINVENDLVSTLSNVFQINFEINNIDSTLFNVENSNVDVHSIISTLIWRCASSWRHINIKTTLKQRWNIFWNITYEQKGLKENWNQTNLKLLTYFMPFVSFDSPCKHQKTSGFLMFSGGIERGQWHEMGYRVFFFYQNCTADIIRGFPIFRSAGKNCPRCPRSRHVG